MPSDNPRPSRKLVIYLLRNGVDPAELMGDKSGLRQYDIALGAGVTGNLYVKEGRPRFPPWADFFAGEVPAGAFGRVASASAVLFAPARQRWFAITFGQGRTLFPSESRQERFGLKVALNLLDEGKLRSMDRTIFEGVPRQAREQASRGVSAREFGLDIETDLVRGVTGVPRGDDFVGILTGADSLSIHADVELSNLTELLGKCYTKFLSTGYRRQYPWIDLIEAAGESTSNELDGIIVERIHRNQPEGIWLAAPDIVSWEDIRGFTYSLSRKAVERYDLRIEQFLLEFKNPREISIELLKNRHVFCINAEGNPIEHWTVYKCLYSELDHGGESFVLTAGKWYRVSAGFVRDVNESYRRIPPYKGSLPELNDDTEGIYNERVSREHPRDFALMDRKTIGSPVLPNPVEFCDLYSARKEIIHVKRRGNSSVLSHLFAQGVVAGELFLTDRAFREAVNENLPRTFRLTNPAQHPDPRQWTVVYAILNSGRAVQEPPFFSRVSARHAARTLLGFQYNVAIANVPVASARLVGRVASR